ncbi:MAG: 3-deoxy-D-manno-octulosonic acid kinase, partial [Rhodanobacter sp.]
NDAASAIVFDAQACAQISPQWFEPAAWRARGALHAMDGGRGGVAVIDTPAGECVLRHYRRGGMVAGVLGDRYLWTGQARTRGFVEFRLLAQIAALHLPASVPIAASYVRQGLFYTAGLITRRVPGAQTLAQHIDAGTLDAPLLHAVGATVARFHRAGIWHADLNAHNILVNASGVYLIDFDRGRLRPAASAWRQSNLRRLRRSLLKLGADAQGDIAFTSTVWQPLLDGYAHGWRA